MPATTAGMTAELRMRLTVTTWNINSVRLRINSVARLIKAVRPDVLCLQETKCPDDRFPLKRFKRLGYEHMALNSQKGYHGVVVLSRLPFDRFDIQLFCGNPERHEYELYLAVEDVDHSRTKTKSPQTNGICERFHKTVLNEFYRVAFRKKVYRSIDKLQVDLDAWIKASSAAAQEMKLEFFRGSCPRVLSKQNPLPHLQPGL